MNEYLKAEKGKNMSMEHDGKGIRLNRILIQ